MLEQLALGGLLALLVPEQEPLEPILAQQVPKLLAMVQLLVMVQLLAVVQLLVMAPLQV